MDKSILKEKKIQILKKKLEEATGKKVTLKENQTLNKYLILVDEMYDWDLSRKRRKTISTNWLIEALQRFNPKFEYWANDFFVEIFTKAKITDWDAAIKKFGNEKGERLLVKTLNWFKGSDGDIYKIAKNGEVIVNMFM